MLVLPRHPGEKIVFRNKHTGELIEIVCVRIQPNAVRLGFEASRDWDILRGELGEFKEHSDEAVAPG